MTDLDRLREKRRAKAAKLKSPKPIELPSGAWRCQVMVQGKRISVVDDDPEVAHTKALAVKNGLIEQKKAPAALTVGEVIDRYIESKDAVLSPATIAGYKKIRKNSLQDLMEVRLPALTREQVQRAVNAMAKDHSPKSVRNAHGLLSAALAAYWPDMVLRTALPQKQPYEVAIPDRKEIKAIIETFAGTKMEVPILLAAWLGLRESEIRGLTWDCIEGNVLHVKRAIVDGENGPVEKGTKTYSGDRYIRMPQRLIDALEKQPRTGDHIVTLSGHAMYNRFRRRLQKLGLPHYRFHDLRHTSASVAMSVGVPNTYNQKRMGHKTDNMLKTVYLHTMKSKEDEFADRIDETFEEILHTDFHTGNEKDEK